jgi:hypothetical protein
MSDEEIELIHNQIKQFKLPVGTSQLINELQNRLTTIKLKRQIVEPPSVPEPTLDSPGSHPSLEIQSVAAQIKEYLEAFSEQLSRHPAHLTAPDDHHASLLYERIEDDRVRRHLIADNMRMERSLRILEFLPDFHEEQAFRRFCTFAAFQVEEMLNYFYFKRYGDDMRQLTSDFRQLRVEVKSFGDNNAVVKSIDKILTFVKIKAYNQEFYGKDFSIYNTLANIRNMEEHRCSVLLKNSSELLSHENFALQMIRERNHNTVRDYLRLMYKNITK